VHACLCNGAEASLPWKLLRTYLESCASIVQAVNAAHPPAGPTKSFAWRCSLKKSVQIPASSWRSRRCGVAQASSDHPCWCRPHPVCLSVALALGHGVYTSQKSIFAIFGASCFVWKANRAQDGIIELLEIIEAQCNICSKINFGAQFLSFITQEISKMRTQFPL